MSTTSQKLKEYLESEENRLNIETGAQLLTLKEIIEELYCTAKGATAEAFKEMFNTILENNKNYLINREMEAVKRLEEKEAREEERSS